MNGDRPANAPRWLRDVLRAPAELGPAMRVARGDEFDSLVADSPEFALRAIEILKRTQAGRLSFVQEPDAAVAAHPAIEAPGVAGRLVDMLDVEPRYRPVAEAMLGHVMVADDLNSAIAASNLNGHGTMFVTRDGDLLEPGRTIAGGSARDDRQSAEAAHRIARERAAADLERAEREHRELDARYSENRAARERCEREIAAMRARAADAERILGDRRGALSRVEQTAALAHAQALAARKRVEEIELAVDAANQRLEALALAEQDSRARLHAIRDQIGAHRAVTERLGTAAMEAAAKVEARKSEIAILERDRDHAVEAARQIELQISEISESLARARSERAEFEAELNQLAEQSAAARIREAELDETVATMRAGCDRHDAALGEARTALGAAREREQQLEAEAMECNLRRERARTLSEELARTFREKFAAEFDSVAGDLMVALEGRDPAVDDSRLAELRAKAERIGEVNLAAESEVKELEERSSVLSAEKTDLEAAVNDLSQTIAKLNREARKRFAETFEGAARNFEELFPKLMRGGKGRLELTEATDVLEAGVNILVQPAGKKVKEIGLLSGGEKALSAMALVFSLFLLNPSPFCVMDEVDAPLDEFSLAQFTGLLTDLKGRSQFIVITHNQRTMQRADQIHGVTMDRPGISKIISLKIPEAA
jgi:chromosome segregation protein